jgi:hypothetical protein
VLENDLAVIWKVDFTGYDFSHGDQIEAMNSGSCSRMGKRSKMFIN